uniref:Cyclin dependent kinase 2 interacting protein n=1 Tax=Lepisosteus oculatus TaxID=7918 RepID=W5MUB0_LEPOC|nr:PREDICTED: cyclin-dependent kinase 2-interacting protein [Lepisosteus oculatus]
MEVSVNSSGNAASIRRPVSTNSARKIKDNAADWHNFILKWDRLNDEGFTIANKIVNLKLSKITENDSESKLECDGSAVSPRSATATEPNQELQDECTELLRILEKMTHLVSKMRKLSSTVKGICALETFHHGDAGRESPLFHTWPTAQFDDVSSKLLESYEQELTLKETIVQEIAHTTDRSLSLVHLSAWLHQPYIEDNTKVLLESMLLETGHRPL